MHVPVCPPEHAVTMFKVIKKNKRGKIGSVRVSQHALVEFNMTGTVSRFFQVEM